MPSKNKSIRSDITSNENFLTVSKLSISNLVLLSHTYYVFQKLDLNELYQSLMNLNINTIKNEGILLELVEIVAEMNMTFQFFLFLPWLT